MSKEDTPQGEEGIKKFIKEQIQKSGYSLQGRVEQKLRNDFGVRREQPLLDKDAGKSRPIDILAIASIPTADEVPDPKRTIFMDIVLVVECKSIPGNAWIFFPDSMPEILLPEYFSVFSDRTPDPFLKYIWPYPNTGNGVDVGLCRICF